VTYAPNGAVKTTGFVPAPTLVTKLSRKREQSLSQLVRDRIGALKNQRCPFRAPAAMFITALGRTVTVSGRCQPRFTELWYALANAVGIE